MKGIERLRRYPLSASWTDISDAVHEFDDQARDLERARAIAVTLEQEVAHLGEQLRWYQEGEAEEVTTAGEEEPVAVLRVMPEPSADLGAGPVLDPERGLIDSE